MEAIIDHNPQLGGHIQVAHGDGCISLVVTNILGTEKHISAVVLKPEEAVDLALDLIIQSRHAST